MTGTVQLMIFVCVNHDLFALCVRDLGDNKHWMKCTLNIGKEFTGKSIAYKYAIHSPNLKDASLKSYPWEYLHQSPWMPGPVNRCLQLPGDLKGIYVVHISAYPLSLLLN